LLLSIASDISNSVRRLKDCTNKAISNSKSREILNRYYSKTELVVERRVVRGTKEQERRPSFYSH